MFFRKKDCSHYLAKGERLVASGQYADARIALTTALERADAGDPATGQQIARLLARCGDELAVRNIEEAETARRSGAEGKAREHLELAIELADDVTLREKAERLLADAAPAPHRHAEKSYGSSCSGCSSHGTGHAPIQTVSNDYLQEHERYELLIQPLPGDLSSRYMELGENFALSYLLSSDGNHAESLQRYLELLAGQESDILLYEIAVQHHHLGDLAACETFLLRSRQLNSTNPLTCVSLVQLYCESGRPVEALQLLDEMIATGTETDQALLLKGDVLRDTGQAGAAIDCYAELLAGAAARSAAERLVPLLEESGRQEDARMLFKRFLKGCC